VIQSVADEELAGMSDTEIRDANGLTDDPEDIVADLEELANAGVTRVLVGSNCGDPRRTIEAFETHVFPHLE
jgi:pseudouridine-5'-phosphate glycosidase